jgi:ABC-2 type transport system permease protein
MIRFLLAVVRLFNGLFRAMRVDTRQLQAILRIKLTMDNRRNTMAFGNQKEKQQNYRFLFVLLSYLLMGGLMAIYLAVIPSMFLGATIFHAFLLVMLAMTLISDYSAVLLDTSDNTILLPRPVDGRTILVARIVHICLYLGQIVLALSLIPAIVLGVQHGPLVLLVFVLSLVLNTFFTVLLTNILYLLVLRFASEEKLKEVINYMQIIFAILFMVGYQVVPRLFRFESLNSFDAGLHWWSYLIPPMWMGGMVAAVAEGNFSGGYLVLTALAFAVPLLFAFVFTRFLSPIFQRKLAVMGTSQERGKQDRAAGTSAVVKNNFSERLANILCKTTVERAGFELIWKVTGRDRKFKLKVYPAIGYFFVIAFVVFFRQGKGDLAYQLAHLGETQFYLAFIYLAFSVLVTAKAEINYTDDFKAAWMYTAAPIAHPGELLSGALKGLAAKVFMPLYLLICIVCLFIWKLPVLDDLLLGLLNNLVMVWVTSLLLPKYLPFSVQPNVKSQSGNFVRGLLVLVVTAIIGLAHYFMSRFIWGVPVLVVADAVVLYFLHKAYKRVEWKGIAV